MTIRKHIVGAVAVAALLAGALTMPRAAFAEDPAVEPGVFKLAIQPWLGYGMWYIAKEKGFFKANGLEDVELVNFVEDKDMGAAIASGQVDGDNESIQQLLVKVQAGIPLKGVLLMDASTKADAILVNFGVQDQAILDILTGNREPSALLPLQMPMDMKTVEKQAEDLPLDMECYRDSEGNAYDFGFGLNWNGVIRDQRKTTYHK